MPKIVLLALLASTIAAPFSSRSAVAETHAKHPKAHWKTSRLTGSPEPPAPYIAERVFPSLTFNEPGEMVAIPGTNRVAILEVKGNIFSFENRPGATDIKPDLFADMKPADPDFFRVYGLTFHPRFAENRYCYISYVTKAKIPTGSKVSRFKVTDTNPPRVDMASEKVIITWMAGGHNGAHLQFGPDGCLYISTGDGGESFPPDGRNTGQDISDLLASILRIDVDHEEDGRAYRIPRDNPFVNTPGARGEVWAYGLRNPWKICFDPADGSLWVADVGWEMWEMVYNIQRGGNYGWSLVEGRQPVHRERSPGPTPVIPPTVEHDHTEARSITGGYFYQGTRLPELRGAYVYGDYVTGKVWALRHDGDKVTWHQELVDTPLQIVTFGIDHEGEVYIVDYAGSLYRLAPNPRRDANQDFPKKLSETGLFTSTAEHAIAPGVVPYSINVEPWADGTTAERFVALPGESQLGTYKKTDVQIGHIIGEWHFPTDGVLARTVSLETEVGNPASARRLETQILHYDVDTWKAYNYIWNEDQTDAILAPDEATNQTLQIKDPAAPGGLRRQTWHHASRTECILCHTTRAASIHGFRVPQLASPPAKGGGSPADQLQQLEALGLFAEPLPAERTGWPSPHDPSADLQSRARAYLHINCAHCHRRGGGGSATFDIQYTHTLEKTALLGNRPTQGTFGIHGAQVVASGDPHRSVLYYRMAKLGHGRMPQFGSQMVDKAGLKLMHDWIASLNVPADAPESAAVAKLRAAEAAAIQALRKRDASSGMAEQSIDRLLASPSGALALITAIDAETLSKPVQVLAISRGTAHADLLIRDLFERYLPEDQRVKRLGSDIKPAEILSLTGDANRGRDLFLRTSGVQCRNCHRLGNEGHPLGPDMNEIGKKHTKEKLLEEILQPSKAIDPQFVTYMVETADGRVLSGLLAKRTETELVLKQAEGKEVRIPNDEVERFAPQQKSLMPELLLQEMTAQQVADLLEFLSQQR